MSLHFVAMFMLKETISDRVKFDGHVILIVCKFMINVFKTSFNETRPNRNLASKYITLKFHDTKIFLLFSTGLVGLIKRLIPENSF